MYSSTKELTSRLQERPRDSPTIAEVEPFLGHIVDAHGIPRPVNACQGQMG